jgi:hypothetical protein
MRVLILMAGFAVVSCSAAATNDGAPPTTGTWGGPEVQIISTSQGATTQFVCAHGTIDHAIAPDANGNFSEAGTYVFEHPATVQGEPNTDSHSARYDGQVSEKTIRISVSVPDKQQVFGPFTATLGTTGPNTRCQ